MRAARACASGRTPSWRRGRKRENDKRGLNRQWKYSSKIEKDRLNRQDAENAKDAMGCCNLVASLAFWWSNLFCAEFPSLYLSSPLTAYSTRTNTSFSGFFVMMGTRASSAG
jgi:hypothetical protein